MKIAGNANGIHGCSELRAVGAVPTYDVIERPQPRGEGGIHQKLSYAHQVDAGGGKRVYLLRELNQGRDGLWDPNFCVDTLRQVRHGGER